MVLLVCLNLKQRTTQMRWIPHKETLSVCKSQLGYRHHAFRNNNARKHNAPTCSLVLTFSFCEGVGWGERSEISSRLAALPRQEEGGTDALQVFLTKVQRAGLAVHKSVALFCLPKGWNHLAITCLLSLMPTYY